MSLGPADSDSPLDLFVAFSELQKLLLQGPGVTEFLADLAVLASAATAPASSCGITLRLNTEMFTVASSGSLASHADEIQYGMGQGPCLQSLRTGEVVHVPDMSREDRWRDYRTRAMLHGVRSSLAVPLTVDGQRSGALNLYTDFKHDFSEDEVERICVFAEQASAALTLVLRHKDHNELEAQLRSAIDSRALIDQAIGIIMVQQGCNAGESFDMLRQTSQSRNLKLLRVATELIETVTGEPARPPRPFTISRTSAH